MSKTTSTLALALFLGMAPAAAIAQTETTAPEAPAVQSQDSMDTQDNMTTQTQDGMSSDSMDTTQTDQPADLDTSTTTEAPAPDSSTVTETPAIDPVPQAQSPEPLPETTTQAEVKESQPGIGQIILQDADSILASSMIGTNVYAPNEEAIGEINDLIVRTDGTVEGVVIGVGGFLGIGQKKVAVEMDSLMLTPQPDGSAPRLVLNSSKEELEAAPEFKTVAEQAYEREQPVAPAPVPAPAD